MSDGCPRLFLPPSTSQLKYEPSNGFVLEGLVHLESAGECDVAVVVAHVAEYLDVCGHLESSSADGAWEALAQRLPKLSPVSPTCIRARIAVERACAAEA
jgi:hypothetical protein